MMAALPRPRSTDGLYEKLVNSLGGIVWEADPRTFQFSFVSPQAEAILGYPVAEWLSDGQFWRRHTHPDDVDWCTAFCVDATAHGRDHQFEYRMIAAEGRVVWSRACAGSCSMSPSASTPRRSCDAARRATARW